MGAFFVTCILKSECGDCVTLLTCGRRLTSSDGGLFAGLCKEAAEDGRRQVDFATAILCFCRCLFSKALVVHNDFILRIVICIIGDDVDELKDLFNGALAVNANQNHVESRRNPVRQHKDS